MKNLLNITCLLLFCFGACVSYAQLPAFNGKDVSQLLGKWKGSLTYLDYTSKKPYTMPANLIVAKIINTNQLTFLNIYPNEPKANNTDTITVLKKGKMLNNEVVKSKKLLANGDKEIVTEYIGIDGNDNKAALIRHTYTFGKSIFIKTEDVQFKGESEWIKRHEYKYNR